MSKILTATFLLFAVSQSSAQWSADPTVNTPICTASGNQGSPAIVTDGAGGAIMAWDDGRGANYDIYAQRIDASGAIRWSTNGVVVCNASGNQVKPKIVSDGAGGAVITWLDFRGGIIDLYAQRLNSSGVRQWTADGVAVCTAAGNQDYPTMLSDGGGGAIITWHDSRGTTGYDIYAQRINGSGSAEWVTDGVAICALATNQMFPVIESDSASGAIIAWQDLRSGTRNVYAQRVNSSGTVQWAIDGVALCTATGDEIQPAIVTDRSGGAIIAWPDGRNLGTNSNYDIYAQHVSGSGSLLWNAGAVPVCTETSSQGTASIVNDGAGGVVVIWDDPRNALPLARAVYAQRLDASGAPQWTTNGVLICNSSSGLSLSAMGDGAGGAVLTWEDVRTPSAISDVFAQRVNASGVVQWSANGAAVCTAVRTQSYPALAGAGGNAVIIAWFDYRNLNGVNSDIYVQKVNSNGTLGTTGVAEHSFPEKFELQQNYPNPFNPISDIAFEIAEGGHVTLKVYDLLGREVAVLVNERKAPGTYSVRFDGSGLSSGVYFYRLQAGSFVETKKLIVLR